jgi:hypothetical protein
MISYLNEFKNGKGTTKLRKPAKLRPFILPTDFHPIVFPEDLIAVMNPKLFKLVFLVLNAELTRNMKHSITAAEHHVSSEVPR